VKAEQLAGMAAALCMAAGTAETTTPAHETTACRDFVTQGLRTWLTLHDGFIAHGDTILDTQHLAVFEAMHTIPHRSYLAVDPGFDPTRLRVIAKLVALLCHGEWLPPGRDSGREKQQDQ
jgi:hypothetical protein